MGNGITWLKNNGFFNEAYYPYNAGGLLSVKTSKKINAGKNLYNKVLYRFGLYSSYNPTVCWTSSFYLSAGTYTHSCKTGFGTCFINVYPTKADADGNTNRISQNSFSDGTSKTETYSSGVWVRIQQNNTGGTQTDYDKVSNSWQIEFGSTATAYESYTANEYPLDDIELRGILKLDGNNNLVYDGDTYSSSGEVVRKYGIVDLGTLDYSYYGGRFNTASPFNDIGGEIVGGNFVNVLCPKYENTQSGNDMTFFVYENKYIYFYDSNYTDATAFKNSLDGIYLVYELASKTTEAADPFTNPMLVDGNGTEEFVDANYYGFVDLGTLDWTLQNNTATRQAWQSAGLSGLIKPPTSLNTPYNAVAEGFAPVPYNFTWTPYTFSCDKNLSGGVVFCVEPSKYADGNEFKNAMNGIILMYEKVTSIGVKMPVGHETIYGEDMKARFTDFGVTVYGGEFNLTTGVLTSTKNADGTDKGTPDVYQLAPASMPVRNGDNYVLGNTNGDAYVKYYKKA